MGPVENGFDPTKHTAEYVAVDREETLSSIIERASEALRRTPNVILVIPRGAFAFNTTQDFLALGKLQWAREVRVAVASPDPTVTGLARVLGFYIVDPPADHPALAGDPALDNSPAPTERSDFEKPTAPLPLGVLPGMQPNPSNPVAPTEPGWVITPAGVPSSSSGSLTTSTWLNMPGEGMGRTPGTPSAPGTPPLGQPSRAGMPPPRTKPRQTGMLLPTAIGDPTASGLPPATGEQSAEAGASPTSEQARARLVVPEVKAYSAPRGWRYGGQMRGKGIGRALSILAVVLVLFLVAGSAYAYVYLPEATVQVSPGRQNVAALPLNVTVTLGEPPAPATPAPEASETATPDERGTTGAGPAAAPSGASKTIAAIKIEAPISQTGTHPATGSREVPRGYAAGTMRFVNTTGSPASVPVGAKFKAANGVIVQTTQGGTVAGTDLFAQRVGTLDLPVASTVEGPSGNIGANQIQGTYAGVLNYTNITALQGGTMETLKVVTQKDIDELMADLAGQVEGQLGGAILGKVEPGQQLITQTISLGGQQFVAERKDGEDGEAVTGTYTATAQAYVYLDNDMHNWVIGAVGEWVRDPINYSSDVIAEVDDYESIQYSTPTILSVELEQGKVTYRVQASARVRFNLKPKIAADIRALVKGKDVDRARSLIMQRYGSYITPPAVSARVLWFNIDKLPSDEARILVEIGGSNGTNGTSTGTGTNNGTGGTGAP